MTTAVKLLTMGAKAWRSVAGENSALEKAAKRRYLKNAETQVRRESGDTWEQVSGNNFVLVRNKAEHDPPTGIFVRGGCDLPSMFTTAPFIREDVKGTVAIYKDEGKAGASRSDQLIQLLDHIDSPGIDQELARLDLDRRIFEADFFESSSFQIPGFPQFGDFPKKAVVISIGSDLARSIYRHKEQGFVIDIGRWWLNQSLEKAIGDTETLRWFKSNFESIGRLEVDEFSANLEKVIQLIREKIGAEVIIYNSLVVDPLNPTHNYQLLNRAHSVRRREFHIALAELSRKLDFYVVDVDRILKEHGIREQVDFAHFPVERMEAIAREAHRVLKELEVV